MWLCLPSVLLPLVIFAARKKTEKLDWMYSHAQTVNAEAYLLGKKIDKNVDSMKDDEKKVKNYFSDHCLGSWNLPNEHNKYILTENFIKFMLLLICLFIYVVSVGSKTWKSGL